MRGRQQYLRVCRGRRRTGLRWDAWLVQKRSRGKKRGLSRGLIEPRDTSWNFKSKIRIFRVFRKFHSDNTITRSLHVYMSSNIVSLPKKSPISIKKKEKSNKYFHLIFSTLQNTFESFLFFYFFGHKNLKVCCSIHENKW